MSALAHGVDSLLERSLAWLEIPTRAEVELAEALLGRALPLPDGRRDGFGAYVVADGLADGFGCFGDGGEVVVSHPDMDRVPAGVLGDGATSGWHGRNITVSTRSNKVATSSLASGQLTGYINPMPNTEQADYLADALTRAAMYDNEGNLAQPTDPYPMAGRCTHRGHHRFEEVMRSNCADCGTANPRWF